MKPTKYIAEIKQEVNRFGHKSPYIDFEGERCWYQSGYGRTVVFCGYRYRLEGLVYPLYWRVHFEGARIHVKKVEEI